MPYDNDYWKEYHRAAESLFYDESDDVTLKWFDPEEVTRAVKDARSDGASREQAVNTQYLLANDYLEYADLKQEIQEAYLDQAHEEAQDPNEDLNPYP